MQGSGRAVAITRFPRGVVPEVDQVFEAAWRATEAEPFVCRHIVARTAAIAVVCAQHPRLGLHCPTCFVSHLPRHDPTIEQTCDRCHLIVEWIYGVTSAAAAMGIRVRRPRGSRGRLYGEVVVGGVGLCGACAECCGLEVPAA